MKSFVNGGRIVVTDTESELVGRFGQVWRVRRADSGAWVNMDEPIPDSLRRFPADDPDGRGNEVILYSRQCEPFELAKGGKP